MNIHLISGFLGSGKTTAIASAASILKKAGKAVAVISNDQGHELVDGAYFEAMGLPSREVSGGCFCCRFNDLQERINSLSESDIPENIFAESVGSCTDIVATVLNPLIQFRKHAHMSLSCFIDSKFLFQILRKEPGLPDEDIGYIFRKQMEEASFLVLNKIDLLELPQLVWLREELASTFPDKKFLFANSLEKKHIEQWLQAISEQQAKGGKTISIDYDRYARGEAKMAWLDLELTLSGTRNNARQQAAQLVISIYSSIRKKGLFIGHLKVLLDGFLKFSFTSTNVETDSIEKVEGNNFSSSLLINARVQTHPDTLADIFSSALKLNCEKYGSSLEVVNQASFSPGYPRPTYRVVY